MENEMPSDTPREFFYTGRVRSVRYALAGLLKVIQTQKNAWLHLISTAAVLIAGWGVGLDRLGWLAVVLALGLVWVAEVLNTAFEFVCDATTPEVHPAVQHAKDIAAGAVLVAAAVALVLGVIAFTPAVIRLLGDG